MHQPLIIYNTLSRKKEAFEPLKPPFVGMYVCGPTVYGDAHLGHARPAISFDVVYRYLLYCGYKVRYVRNITDVGHLENDADAGEDKIAKKARLEQLEPMEVAQYYSDRYHENISQLNCRNPSIEPRASGHIIEQIKMIEDIIANGFAYEVNGSVYFDVLKYNEGGHYGKLSGRIIEDLMANTRDLDGQDEKRNQMDFALWKKAMPEHIMRWKSPWGEGFPGWHIECSAMSAKYLGETFDIHGGGMDLLFPHHECEIAQSQAGNHKEPVKYWMHNNMITINGQKMGKSLGNFITLNELFFGKSRSIAGQQTYSPMTIRFFILQAHYRSTLDFSNEALQAAEKGLKKLMTAMETLQTISTAKGFTSQRGETFKELEQKCYDAMNDDLNTPIVIAHLFEAVRIVNSVKAGTEQISEEDKNILKKIFNDFVIEILGLKQEATTNDNSALDGVMNILIELRNEAKLKKDFGTSDKIRDELSKIKITLKDTKDGAVWSYE